MSSKEFLLQRICAYAKQPINPDDDKQVSTLLKEQFNILLPQRRDFNQSLQDATSDHEILRLLVQYRLMD
ncbi:hypothetical protein [Aestuariirhabdus litorea]|uniref:Uncharacterized protein n=1 Tax=Aestuariirhabdus litorea TaxID=2528527 RepID=A0A3P3VJV9_9GAMM|nr:hypothetical protein [Aestuariirhabdus litorea]RRJ83000.1 hypothetical protein D0544_14235 [Aestuariirhabdus litorea]RWW93159.1 hypothetical protein DZC74_14210 [Endozoicomonadaceae bacterium GTF-13]